MAKATKRKAAPKRNGRKPQKEWTVMVYMVAGNDTDLDAVAVADLREMERGVGLNEKDDVHVVVQINRAWPDTAQRYEISKVSHERSAEDFHRGRSVLLGPVKEKARSQQPRPAPGTDMATEETLEDFIIWARRYRAKHYFLVLWGHSYGLGFGRDHGNALTLGELRRALTAFRNGRRNKTPLELLGTNACAMSYAEAIYELRNSAQFMVTSQIAVPLDGFPYESILRRVGQDTGPETLGRLVVDSYVSHFNALLNGERVTMTLLKLESAPQLKPFVQGLATAIGSDLTPQKATHIRDVFTATATGDVRPLIDLKELCTALSETEPSLTELKHTADNLLSGLILKHESHPTLKDSLNGIGIYAPFVTDEKDLRRLELVVANGDATRNGDQKGRVAYERLELFEGSDDTPTSWPKLVYDGLRSEIPFELMTSIRGIGVTNRTERGDIAQIIMSIDASFNMLDHATAIAKRHVVEDLQQAPTKSGLTSGTPKGFGRPWLQLAGPSKSTSNGEAAADGHRATADGGLSTVIVDRFIGLEQALARVERATRRGLTHARFGIGPSTLAIGFIEDVSNSSAGPRNGAFNDIRDPKSAGSSHGAPNGGASPGGLSAGGDLRGDLALARVQELFAQVGQSLQDLETSMSDLEVTAKTTLTDLTQPNGLSPQDHSTAATQPLTRAFRVLEEFSLQTRRTVRRVLTHPIYGLGPSERGIGLEEREALADSGGLAARSLRLL
jgi:hypothetical protein